MREIARNTGRPEACVTSMQRRRWRRSWFLQKNSPARRDHHVLLPVFALIGDGNGVSVRFDSFDHSSLPVFESKALNRLSLVAAMNTSPPAVAILPPRLSAPECCTPLASSVYDSDGAFHAIRRCSRSRRPVHQKADSCTERGGGVPEARVRASRGGGFDVSQRARLGIRPCVACGPIGRHSSHW